MPHAPCQCTDIYVPVGASLVAQSVWIGIGYPLFRSGIVPPLIMFDKHMKYKTPSLFMK